ncbi:hypothetical protein [Actinomadura sp. 21ATH]|uniref:hypothetical protein n=1 Tax=Actinomadura sp. 21ATH TaxID=1735444 RepID=UPI0035C26823
MDNKATGVVLDIGQPGAVVHAHPMEVLASGAHRDVDVLLSMASDDMGWWVANDLDRFDPRTLDRVVDEVAGWRISRSRATKLVDAYDQGGRTPAEVRAALMADYLFGLPAARGALAHAAAGGNARLLVIGPAEGAPAVHGSEMYALVGQEKPGRSAEQAERDTRIGDIVLDFAAAAGRPVCGPLSPAGPPREASATCPGRPPPTTGRSSTCGKASTALEGQRAVRDSERSPTDRSSGVRLGVGGSI